MDNVLIKNKLSCLQIGVAPDAAIPDSGILVEETCSCFSGAKLSNLLSFQLK